MSDNEHALASLGQPEILSVQHPPGPPIPALGKTVQELIERSFIVGENAGHVFPHAPAGLILCKNGKIAKGEISARISQSSTQSRNREGLAGRSSDQNVDCDGCPFVEFEHVSIVGNLQEVVFKDCTGESLDLRHESTPPAKRSPRHGSRFDARADGTKGHVPAPPCREAETRFTAQTVAWRAVTVSSAGFTSSSWERAVTLSSFTAGAATPTG